MLCGFPCACDEIMKKKLVNQTVTIVKWRTAKLAC